MGERGPVNQPTWLKKMKGNPGKRPINKDEPKAKLVDWLPAPDWMAEDRRKIWTGVTRELAQLGCLATCDRFALERYCELLFKWRQVQWFLQHKAKDNFSYPIYHPEIPELRSEDGTVVLRAYVPRVVKYNKAFPEVKMLLEFNHALLRLEAHFGLTPSSRSRIIAEGDPDNDTDDFNDL